MGRDWEVRVVWEWEERRGRDGRFRGKGGYQSEIGKGGGRGLGAQISNRLCQKLLKYKTICINCLRVLIFTQWKKMWQYDIARLLSLKKWCKPFDRSLKLTIDIKYWEKSILNPNFWCLSQGFVIPIIQLTLEILRELLPFNISGQIRKFYFKCFCNFMENARPFI